MVGRRFAKKQQMQWSKVGAHRLLQTRTKTLDGTLRDLFTRWYPDMAVNGNQVPASRQGGLIISQVLPCSHAATLLFRNETARTSACSHDTTLAGLSERACRKLHPKNSFASPAENITLIALAPLLAVELPKTSP